MSAAKLAFDVDLWRQVPAGGCLRREYLSKAESCNHSGGVRA